MWTIFLVLPANGGLGEIISIDATGEQVGGLVVRAFTVGH